MAYVFVEYPKWLHREGKASVLVDTPDAEAAQVAAWGSSAPKPTNALLSVHKPHDEPPTDIAALRETYKAKFGKKPFAGWDAGVLKAKIEAA